MYKILILKSSENNSMLYKFYKVNDEEFKTDDLEELENVLISLYKIFPVTYVRVISEQKISIDVQFDPDNGYISPDSIVVGGN